MTNCKHLRTKSTLYLNKYPFCKAHHDFENQYDLSKLPGDQIFLKPLVHRPPFVQLHLLQNSTREKKHFSLMYIMYINASKTPLLTLTVICTLYEESGPHVNSHFEKENDLESNVSHTHTHTYIYTTSVSFNSRSQGTFTLHQFLYIVSRTLFTKGLH